MKKIVFFVFSSLVVFGITMYYRLGAYKDVQMEFIDYPEIHLLYKEHLGAYHKINDTLNTVEAAVTAANQKCIYTFGEYLDDPRKTEERRLRANGGCVVDSAAIAVSGLLSKTIPSRKAVRARFDGAPSIGPIKVYPKVESWLTEKSLVLAGPVIEIYTIINDREASTEYVFPIATQQ